MKSFIFSLKVLFIALLFLVSFETQRTLGCTNFLITKSASVEGANMITYNADSHTLYGCLYHYPAAKYPPGTMLKVYDWDSGEYLGEIPQANQTYNVIGNMNEFGVAIGETTFGGLEELSEQPGAIIDYGSLIYIALQRSKTAREAIQVMTQLVSQYGYASEGESFSIADFNEVWVMEMIGKGRFGKGAVWVAVKIPDGYISAHANQARIQQFALNDPQNVLYSPDVISFARERGYYPKNAPDEQFSFSDVYNPVTFDGARGCDARVWSFFRQVVTGMDSYVDYVTGKNLTHRMPLYVKPFRKISVNDTMNFLRDHYEGTCLDFHSDVGAGPFNLPYRWRPLNWDYKNKSYFHERSTATQQTAFTFVAQLRPWLPPPIGALLWFGVDDSDSAVYAPMYAGMTRVPTQYAKGNGDIMTFSFDSAFWIFNLVNNWAYTRYNLMHPEVAAKIAQYENRYFKEVPQIDQKAASLYQKGDITGALSIITEYSVSTGSQLVKDWLYFFMYLFTKYMDGNVKIPDPPHQNPKVEWPGYGDAWLARIIQETGDRYLHP